jgi:hypothetical protein
MAQPEDFTYPEEIKITDVVWLKDREEMVGPLLVIEQQYIGYGSNRRLIWIMVNTDTNEIYQSEGEWIRVPKEEK